MNGQGTHPFAELIKRGANIRPKPILERQASIDPDSLVAIFYKPGITGQPKAATLINFEMLNLLHGQLENIGQFLTRVCAPISIYHIFAEMVGVLNVVFQKCQAVFSAISPDTVSAMGVIHEEERTALIGSPVIFRDILTHLGKENYDLSSLALGVLGARPMQREFLRRLEVELPVTRVTQSDGMTENVTLFASAYWAGDADQQRSYSSMGVCMQRLEIIIRSVVNIYPAEIETAIIEHLSVFDAQVFGIPDERYGEEVRAWITLKPDTSTCTTDEIV
ncbi:unnamed protein product [Rotaria magnacalcarata]|uniref:Medium-chain acyl-CoA ligase ACSF2, mitochondrial n=1 Tax=Rotaria magnacalcarata TaxID=392030 RepID=A0A816R1U3_9BILA|nr:unnamed protein product [Rotaria magnacalcarata]CAF2066943.1 unnamed protein product [Rotaria magnacalcarata]